MRFRFGGNVIPWLCCILFSVAPFANAAEWPQYRGPDGDGITSEQVSPWTSQTLKQLWKIPVGEAFGSFAVADGRGYYFANRNGVEVCHAVDVSTGKEFWATDIGRTIYENEGGNGPRTTPAVSDGRVCVMSTYCKLVCLDASSGKPVWSHDLVHEFGGKLPNAISKWGNATSPLIEKGKVIVAGGGNDQSLLAFDLKDGHVLWKTGSESITHASPTPATILGARQVIFYTTSGLVSIDPDNGRWLWHARVKFSVATAASPVVEGDIVYCSSGYGVGATAFKIQKNGDAFSATQLWKTPGKLVNLWSTPIAYQGHLYGLYGFKEFNTMPLKCIDVKTGKEIWSHEGFGQGGLILAGGNLLVQGDQGELVLVKADPSGYHELARAQPLAGKCWQMPIVAEGKIITRSTKEAVCLQVP